MSADNKVSFSGNLTQDPELRFTPSGHAVVNFSIAVDRGIPQGDGTFKNETSFFDCVVWRSLAEHFAASFSKGQRLIVTGKLIQRRWVDKETQENRYKVEIDVDDVGASVKWGEVTGFQKTTGNGNGGSRTTPMEAYGETDEPF